MSAPSTDRLQQLAKLYAKHDAQLLRLVRRRVAAQPATAADACSYAWAQLLAAEHIDQELAGFRQIGDGDTDVIHAGESGDRHDHLTS